MRIDFRLLLPLAVPLAIVFICRAVLFVAGVPWDGDIPDLVSFCALFFGIVIGGTASVLLFCEGVDIGGFQVGGRQDD